MRFSMGVGVVLLVATLVGCGQSAQDKRAAAAKAAAHRRAVQQRIAYQRCTETLGALRDSLGELDSRLAVGLSFDKYSTKVADAQVVYDRVEFDRLRDYPTCLKNVGIPLEKALNQYAKAAEIWNDCLGDFDCDTSSIDPDLQDRWARARDAIESAKGSLEELRPVGDA